MRRSTLRRSRMGWFTLLHRHQAGHYLQRSGNVCSGGSGRSVPALMPSYPEGVEIADGGDGTVPSWSASIPGMQQLAVGGDHGGLYKTPEVLRTLGALLGKQGVLSSDINPERVRISPRDEVMTPGFLEPVVLFFNTPTGKVEAEIVVARLASSDGQPLQAPAIASRLSFSYSGAPIDSLALKIEVPEFAGIYELDVQAGGASIAENNPRMMVQQE